MDNEFFSPLTVVKRLGALCLGVMMLYTFGWTAFIAQHEVRTGNHPGLGERGDSHRQRCWAGRHAHSNLLDSDDCRAGHPGRDDHGNREVLGKQVRQAPHREAQGGGQSRRQRGRHGGRHRRRQSRGHGRRRRRRQSRGQGRRRSRRQPPLDGVEQPPP